jgi:V8-like Glu-specific endopeptidase
MSNVTPHIAAAGDINNAMYGQTAGPTFSGVARLILTRSDGTFICTGSVIGNSSILTAGHCVTGGNATAVTNTVTALLSDGLGNTISLNTSSYAVHPTWNGSIGFSTDLAVFNFASVFPNWVTRYALYNTNDELNQVFTVAGFGMTGSFGAAATGGAGTFHQGQNVWERLLTNMGGSVDNLVMDFDNGNTNNDAFRIYYGLSNTGLGALEVNTAPGDSGGPSFIAGKVAGVTSFGFTLGSTGDCAPVSPTNTPNSSCGEFSSMVRVSSNTAWIQSAMVPEPATCATMIAALGLLAWRVRKPATTA